MNAAPARQSDGGTAPGLPPLSILLSDGSSAGPARAASLCSRPAESPQGRPRAVNRPPPAHITSLDSLTSSDNPPRLGQCLISTTSTPPPRLGTAPASPLAARPALRVVSSSRPRRVDAGQPGGVASLSTLLSWFECPRAAAELTALRALTAAEFGGRRAEVSGRRADRSEVSGRRADRSEVGG